MNNKIFMWIFTSILLFGTTQQSHSKSPQKKYTNNSLVILMSISSICSFMATIHSVKSFNAFYRDNLMAKNLSTNLYSDTEIYYSHKMMQITAFLGTICLILSGTSAFIAYKLLKNREKHPERKAIHA